MKNLGRAVVYGQPKEGGNKTPMPIYRGSRVKGTREFTGRVAMVEGRRPTERVRVKAWREAVTETVRKSPLWDHRVIVNPVVVKWYFTMKAPQRIPAERFGFPAVRPDADKLVRATCDAVTDSGLWKDDSLIVSEIISKAYAGKTHADGTPALDIPGCIIEIFEILSESA